MYEELTVSELEELTQKLYRAADCAFWRSGIPWLPKAWRTSQGRLARELHELYTDASTELLERKVSGGSSVPVGSGVSLLAETVSWGEATYPAWGDTTHAAPDHALSH